MGALAVLWNPVQALREIAGERRVLAGLVVTAVVAVLGLISAVITVLGGDLQSQLSQPTGGQGLPPEIIKGVTRGFQIGLPVSAVLAPFIWWILVSLVMQLVTRFFGGTGPLSGMFAVVGVSQMPLVLSGIIGMLAAGLQLLLGSGGTAASLIGLLSGLLALAFFVWHIVLVVIGASLARGVGYGESTGSCAISCVGIVLLGILIALVVGFGAAFIFGGAAGTQ